MTIVPISANTVSVVAKRLKETQTGAHPVPLPAEPALLFGLKPPRERSLLKTIGIALMLGLAGLGVVQATLPQAPAVQVQTLVVRRGQPNSRFHTEVGFSYRDFSGEIAGKPFNLQFERHWGNDTLQGQLDGRPVSLTITHSLFAGRQVAGTIDGKPVDITVKRGLFETSITGTWMGESLQITVKNPVVGNASITGTLGARSVELTGDYSGSLPLLRGHIGNTQMEGDWNSHFWSSTRSLDNAVVTSEGDSTTQQSEAALLNLLLAMRNIRYSSGKTSHSMIGF